MFTYLTLGLLLIIIMIQFYKGLKATFKISYYETRLENNGFDIAHVKSMSLWQMFR